MFFWSESQCYAACQLSFRVVAASRRDLGWPGGGGRAGDPAPCAVPQVDADDCCTKACSRKANASKPTDLSRWHVFLLLTGRFQRRNTERSGITAQRRCTCLSSAQAIGQNGQPQQIIVVKGSANAYVVCTFSMSASG